MKRDYDLLCFSKPLYLVYDTYCMELAFLFYSPPSLSRALMSSSRNMISLFLFIFIRYSNRVDSMNI